MSFTRLVIAPHADDETLGCGGMLAKYKEESHVLVLAKPSAQARKAIKAVQQILGYSKTHFADLTDTEVGRDDAKLSSIIDSHIQNLKPDFLYIPAPASHQDHQVAYYSGLRGARLSMREDHWTVPNILVYETPVYDMNFNTQAHEWNFLEELTQEEAELKQAAIDQYPHPKGAHPAANLLNLARTAGLHAGVEYAERYSCLRMIVTARPHS